MRKSKIIFMVIGLLLIVLTVSTLTLYFIYNSNIGTSDSVFVKIFIDYGSLKEENYEEFNITISGNKTALYAFSQVVELELTNYSFGVYIIGVNGYTEQFPDYWAFFYYDYGSESWTYSEKGVGDYIISDGDHIKLQYSG